MIYAALATIKELHAQEYANMIDDVLNERGKRYGKFKDHAYIAQGFKLIMVQQEGWMRLADDQKEALEMIIKGQIGELLFRRVKTPSLDEVNRVTVKLAPGESVRAGQCVDSRPDKSLRDKVGDRVDCVVIGGRCNADPKDWFFALIDVLDLERSGKL